MPEPTADSRRHPPQALRGTVPDTRCLLGIIVSDKTALLDAAGAIKLLENVCVGFRVFVMPPTGTGKLAVWVKDLRAAGGFALWIIVTSSLEVVHRTAALDTDLPLFCQASGMNAREQQAALFPRMSELTAALLPAGRMREAAMHLASIAALLDDNVRVRLDRMRESGATAAAKNSDYITANIHAMNPAVEPTREHPAAIAAEDEELLSKSASGMMQPRIASKKEKDATKPSPPKAFDYSVPLRQVLTGAKEIAAAYRHPQVAPEHLLAAIMDCPECAAHALLIQAGVNLETLAGHLIPHFPPPHDQELSGMFSMADNTWTVLENARTIARERQRPCLTTLDFLESIALRTSSGATASLWESGLLATHLSEAISKADASEEYASVKPKHVDAVPTGIDPDRAREVRSRLGQVKPDEPAVSEPLAAGFSPEPNAKPDILRCDPSNPDLEIVETVADALLEGRLAAFPIDTMYALVADATNAAAVQRLRDAIQRDASQNLGALIHSTTQLKHLVKNVPAEVMKMLDELWPGPLTVVFDRHPQRLAHLSNEPTLGLRIPNDYLSLAILSTAGRPLAATSIQLAAGEGAKDIAERLAGIVDIVVDTGEPAGAVTTTVVSVAQGGPTLMRHGATDPSQIENHLGKLGPE